MHSFISRSARVLRECSRDWPGKWSSLKEWPASQLPAQPFRKAEREPHSANPLATTRVVSASEYFASFLSGGCSGLFADLAVQCAKDKHSKSTISQEHVTQLLKDIQSPAVRLEPSVTAPLRSSVRQSTGAPNRGKEVENASPVAGELSAAAEKFQKTIRLCTSSSQVLLALHHAKASNVTEAVTFLKLASDQGSAQALFNLAVFYELGHGVQKDLLMARELYERAANLGHAKASFNLAICYLDGNVIKKDIDKGVSLLTQAAEQGIPEAQYELGRAYLYGDGVAQDVCRAVELLRAAASHQDSGAQHLLAHCCLKGLGVPQDTDEGLKLLWTSAKHRNFAALHDLAVCFEKGLHGVEENRSTAMRLFRSGAAHNHRESQTSLARLELSTAKPTVLAPAEEQSEVKVDQSTTIPLLRSASAHNIDEPCKSLERWKTAVSNSTKIMIFHRPRAAAHSNELSQKSIAGSQLPSAKHTFLATVSHQVEEGPRSCKASQKLATSKCTICTPVEGGVAMHVKEDESAKMVLLHSTAAQSNEALPESIAKVKLVTSQSRETFLPPEEEETVGNVSTFSMGVEEGQSTMMQPIESSAAKKSFTSKQSCLAAVKEES